MKKISVSTHVNIIVGLLILCLIAGTISIIYQIRKGYAEEKRPTIEVWTVNITPASFSVKHPELLSEVESPLYWAFVHGKNKKWQLEYVYVYVIKKDTKYFERVIYLGNHQADAVDNRVIFSNSLPDSKDFIIIYK